MNHRVRQIALQQPVLDLGAGQVGTSSYHSLIPLFDTFDVYSVDISTGKKPTVLANLEQGIPFEDNRFKSCLAFNLFEHLYRYEFVLSEIRRVMAPGGYLYVSVPFLARVHSDPGDYFRYTRTTLERLVSEVGLVDITIEPFGAGAVTAALSQVDFMVPRPLRALALRIAVFMDSLITRRSGGKYRNVNDYPLGYFLTAQKQL